MISKREKLQYVCTFVTDILSLALSIALGWLVVDGLLGKVENYTAPDLIQAFCLLMLAYLLTFLTFDQSENITTRPWKRELKISVGFNLILTLINSAGLLLTKAPLLSSRYFLVAVPVINVVLMTVFHSVLKKLLTTTRKKNSMESLVGVVTTGEHAGEMVRELQRDWSKRLTGIALLEIPEEQIGGQIEGVDIKANYDTFMDWLRQAALDEVYVDIPMDSGDSFVPYLKEMESMGLTVHFRLPLLDRIDLYVEVPPLAFDELSARPAGESSAEIKKRVNAARAVQTARFGPDGPDCNAHMGPKELQACCELDEGCRAVMQGAFDRMGLTARSYDRILRVARTIADLEGSEHIQVPHLAEALQYRESSYLRQ